MRLCPLVLKRQPRERNCPKNLKLHTNDHADSILYKNTRPN